MSAPARWIAFADQRCIGSGTPVEVATACRQFVEDAPLTPILVFDAVTSRPVEIDLRGALFEVLARLPHTATEAADVPPEGESAASVSSPESPVSPGRARSPGRPRLGVVPREVTLLPRHWDWLASQPGGASVALRKLVEAALRANREQDQQREAAEAAFRFMNAIAGDEPGFEAAIRALYAQDRQAFAAAIADWPSDLSAHSARLAGAAFANTD